MQRRRYKISFAKYRRVKKGIAADGSGDVVKRLVNGSEILEGPAFFNHYPIKSWFKHLIDASLPVNEWVIVLEAKVIGDPYHV